MHWHVNFRTPYSLINSEEMSEQVHVRSLVLIVDIVTNKIINVRKGITLMFKEGLKIKWSIKCTSFFSQFILSMPQNACNIQEMKVNCDMYMHNYPHVLTCSNMSPHGPPYDAWAIHICLIYHMFYYSYELWIWNTYIARSMIAMW